MRDKQPKGLRRKMMAAQRLKSDIQLAIYQEIAA
jgi:hypothetical protein